MRGAAVIVIITLYFFITQPAWVYGTEPRIEDQGDTLKCGVYTVCNAIEYQMQLKGIETPKNGFSKEWLWEKCGEADDLSNGIKLVTALDVALNCGLCPAEEYGTNNADRAAEQYKITTYSAISHKQFKDNLIRDRVIIIATRLSQDNWQDGILQTDTDIVTERHASYLIGFDEITEIDGRKDYYIGVNSWGEQWGFAGKYYMRYNFAPSILDAFVFEL